MSYKILLERKALKFINKQPSDQKKRILSAIYKLPIEGDFQLLAGAGKIISVTSRRLSCNLHNRR